ncbi:MAG: aminotransferase class I/II-fold pyridoxal phosphate-dependent enzyme [Gammaproteobacteria bacterium]|nr:aminotransferase class I/II-fold pyridoxal phosphate-dependent enzyme [Gammaproteobacteria bacterium]MDH5239862.1 aminotransferase class I/II-fold pyridoxal phosphate-dependent enzyme [Gammaproteobacteria bacterium]MDH5260367.1 aminotransferase class I/II-fold pyridoxal phosphate-dependent enzyme [Gammaproteobacteria bacterium]MDH5583429.1 aminotransferase class I/II-fold pyridoxal phosphate-dependent enzyme [Gammaproteobacteria bacterium]
MQLSSSLAKPLQRSRVLQDVRYEIRGQLANHALELERRGYEIISLNIGNPGLFGFRTPETMRLAMIENLAQAEPYCHQKGIFPAREAVVMQQQNRGIRSVTADEVFIGNGVSELIDLSLRALLNPGDEVLVPSPDYPLWSAAVALNGGKAVHYRCASDNGFQPDIAHMESLITKHSKAIVVINPNNPSGAVYGRNTLEQIVALAAKHSLVVLADEIYDQMVYDEAEFVPLATLAADTICVTFSGLSKIYRACGYRVGWAVFSGDLDRASDYMQGMELLSALRLCSNVPGQWAVQTALGGFQSIQQLVTPGGRLYQSRQSVIERAAASKYLHLEKPMGAMYAFLRLDERFRGKLDDQSFARTLLENHHVLVAPGSSFNTPYADHFRITTLPDTATIDIVFDRIETCLESFC